jgi:hypothetical protein
MADPLNLKPADNIVAARGTDYFLMKEQRASMPTMKHRAAYD